MAPDDRDRQRDPHLLPLFFSALLAGLFGLVAIAETDSWWVVGATFAAFVLLVLAIVVDVSRSVEHDLPPNRAGRPDALQRVLVVTSEPLPARRVLDAVARQTGSAPSAANLGVMVVSPEGFGAREIMGDESQYQAARRAEGETVASLRRASVKAAGHVGDRDAEQAVADALALFPADCVLVFPDPGNASPTAALSSRTPRAGGCPSSTSAREVGPIA
jgi:membrane protein implicated in regulation of membrane protease activity